MKHSHQNNPTALESKRFARTKISLAVAFVLWGGLAAVNTASAIGPADYGGQATIVKRNEI